MSLGFARDSILNLQELAQAEEEAERNNAAIAGSAFQQDNYPDGDMGLFLDDEVEEPTSTMVPFVAPPSPGGIPLPQPIMANENSASAVAQQLPPSSGSFEDEPQTPPASATANTNNTAYAAFQSDYAEFENYYSYDQDPYAVGYGGYGGFTTGQQQGQQDVLKKGKKKLLCCLFPWAVRDEDFDDSSSEGDDNSIMDEAESEQRAAAASAPAAAKAAVPSQVEFGGDDNNNGAFEEEKKCEDLSGSPRSGGGDGEKKSGSAINGSSGSAAAAAIPPPPIEPPPKLPVKGILKKSVIRLSAASVDLSGRAGDDASSSAGDDHRRHMFPTYAAPPPAAATDDDGAAKKTNRLTFAPMARVVTVSSRKDMPFLAKTQVWWQRTDYDDFKKTGRIIAKAMLEGGSEIWLTSNDAWGKKKSKAGQQGSSNDDDEDERDTDYERALHEYSGGRATRQDPGEEPKESDSSGNKWWCKFGHSRRGLEHIASMVEGRQRQRNVNTAIKAVVEEQRRQRLHRNRDPVKLAHVAQQYTSWARDLALAAGAADAEAVRVNFAGEAKTRSHYLVTGVESPQDKMAKRRGTFTDSRKYSFISGHLAAEILDANTSSSFASKRAKEEEEAKAKQQQKQQQAAASVTSSVATPPTQEEEEREEQREEEEVEQGGECEEAIHDPTSGGMAKKAAGFAANETEKVDMSAVLTGMGSVTVQG